MCLNSLPVYIPSADIGIKLVASESDGNNIIIQWNKAYPEPYNFNIGYNIYYSTEEAGVFSEGPKYLSIDPNVTVLTASGFTPGDVFYFAVRATQFDPQWINLNSLPDSGTSKVYPEGVLLSPVSETDLFIQITDIDKFPSFGVVQVGNELMYYSNKDIPGNKLLGITRGFLDSNIRYHNIDGYDGYHLENPIVTIYKGFEEQNHKILIETCDFQYPNFALATDGYYNEPNPNLLTSDYAESDADLSQIPAYDFKGYHRIDPNDILLGKCVGSYIGGEHFCADGYSGVGRVVRGVPITSQAIARLEVLLDSTANPCILVRRRKSGIRCACFISSNQAAESRCEFCLGGGYVVSWEQVFNTRRSDSRILVRFDPTPEKVEVQDGGWENTFAPNCWTLPMPTLYERDMLIRYNKYTGQEEWRYEITSVTRNVLFNEVEASQQFSAIRVRKTDPFWKFNVFPDSSTMPQLINTSVAMVPGIILPHSHQVMISEKIVNISQINQVSQVGGAMIEQYHSHDIRNGVVQESYGHVHSIIL